VSNKFISCYKNQPDGKFITRYAVHLEKKQELDSFKAKSEFDVGYREGKVKYALACKYMRLNDCGLNRFVEASNNTFWTKQGDEIIRVENDLNWVDDFLKEQESKNEIH
jgi:hypothetical protein